MVYELSVASIALIIGGVLAALALVAAMRRLFPADILRAAHEATGTMLTIVGTLYAVLLGLIVVDATVRFERAMDKVQQESNSLADIFLLADRFPDPYRSRIQEACRSYARQVVDIEWSEMAQGRMSVEARRTALALTTTLDGFEPATESQKIVFPLILEQMRQLWDRRRDRATAVHFGIPIVEWVTLFVGAVVVVVFVGLFNVDHAGLQLLLTGLAALVISLNLYLVALFGYPFVGDLTVSKRPFLLDIGIFAGQYQTGPADAGETDTRPR